MKNCDFYILDVFAEKKYAGNQLLVLRNAATLSDTEMQKIAREINFSETTFILSDETRDSGYDVRIFTPNEEIPFAGHPVLGTAFIIRNEIIKKQVDSLILNLKIGQIPVSFERYKIDLEILWMKQIPPSFGTIFSPDLISLVLSLNQDDIDNRFPIQEVSTGLPSIIIPLKNLELLRKARVDKEKYFELVKNTHAKTLLIFSTGTYDKENDLSVRVFADYYGVPEDPATGSANGCLAGYLVKHCYFGANKINLCVEQGYEIRRPSLLYLKAQEEEDGIEVQVGGKVVMVAKGLLL